MKISLNWLKSYIDFSLTASELASLLTQRGLEVSQIYSTIKGNLEGLVIGQVRSCLPHPNAERLKETLVDIGFDKPLAIICGATNVAIGQKVVVAPIGSTIYSYLDQSPLQIKKVKIRGLVSEGMLCAEDEIGIGPAHEGILVLDTPLPPGTPAKVYFKDLLDEILEIEITPNRADACAHLGIAREIKAILDLPTTLPSVETFYTVPSNWPLSINNLEPTLCPRYVGVLITNSSIKPSPTWLQRRLAAIGLKAINNVVDVTNFVLHELGQPLHAFDYDTIMGKSITLQRCAPGNLFTGLDGIERKLSGNELMICDQVGPIAMAGILGGLRTSVTHSTQHVFIESAYFTPSAIRDTAQYHHLKTDASFRFERGTDPNLPLYALKRAALLLQEMMPSVTICQLTEYYPTPISDCHIDLTYKAIKELLGVAINETTVKKILTNLEIVIQKETAQGLSVKVPPYRVDVTRTADLIEEIARIYGYDAIPSQLPASYLSPESREDNAYKIAQEISTMLVANGYYEICTNSLTKEAYGDIVTAPKVIHLVNPLSASTSILRPTLLFSGLEVIAYNAARREPDLKLFELGIIYYEDKGLYKEEQRLSLWLTGQIEPPNWERQLGSVTLQDVRATIEQIMQRLGVMAIRYSPINHPFYKHSVQAIHKDKVIVTFGEMNPAIIDSTTQAVFFADINWMALLESSKLHSIYDPIGKFPPVTRDLSLVVDKATLFQNIKDLIIKKGDKKIQKIHLFDIYEGPNIPADKKAYAIRFTLQDKEKTLDDKSIDQIMDQLMQTFERDLNVIIRR